MGSAVRQTHGPLLKPSVQLDLSGRYFHASNISVSRFIFQHLKEFSRRRVEDRTIETGFKAATGRGHVLDNKLFGGNEPSFLYKVRRA